MGERCRREIGNRHGLGLLALLALSLAAASAPASQQQGSRQQRALIVCVSDYESRVPPRRETAGWRNLATHRDAQALSRVLVETWSFKPENILILLDAKAYSYAPDLFDTPTGLPKAGRELKGVPYNATLAGIRAAWQQFLVEPSRAGDVAVAHFSGHGEQLRDDGRDEPDRLDEAFVPYDYVGVKEENARTDLRDDELGRMLDTLRDRLNPKGAAQDGNLTVFVDSCHSGSMARGALIPRNHVPTAETRAKGLADVPREGVLTPEGSGLEEANQPIRGYVLLSACQSAESAYELEVGGERRGGTFTQKLCQALQQKATITYQRLFETLTLGVKSVHPYQTPAIHGEVGGELFGKYAAPAASFPSIQVGTDLVEGRFRINIGDLHGVTSGSILRLYPRDSGLGADATPLRVDGSPVDLRVTGTRLGDCDAELVRREQRSRLTPDLVGARARVVQTTVGGDPLRVLVEEPELREALFEPDLQPGEDALELLTSSRGGDGQRYHVRLTLEPVGTGKGLRVRHANNTIVTDFPWPLNEGDRARLRPLLINIWRRRLLYDLGRTGLASDMKVEMRLQPVGASTNLQGTLLLKEGQQFRILVKNTGTYPVFLNIVNVMHDGGLALLFPDPRIPLADKLVPGAELALPAFEVTPPLGQDLFKVIATPEPLDLAPLIFDASHLPRGARGDREAQARTGARGAPDATSGLQRLFLNTSMTRRGQSTTSTSAWTSHTVLVQTSK